MNHNADAFGRADDGAFVKILSCGCERCQTAQRHTRAALSALGLKPAVRIVTDERAISGYGSPKLPTMVICGRVITEGEVLSVEQIIGAITSAISIQARSGGER